MRIIEQRPLQVKTVSFNKVMAFEDMVNEFLALEYITVMDITFSSSSTYDTEIGLVETEYVAFITYQERA